jgi:hypothetical protein
MSFPLNAGVSVLHARSTQNNDITIDGLQEFSLRRQPSLSATGYQPM